MNKNLIISPNADVAQIADTIADAFSVGITIGNALEDGFQWSDLLQIASQEPVIREVVNDVPAFLAAFKNLDEATAIEAVELAKQKTLIQFGGDFGRVPSLIYDYLLETARTYGFVRQTVENGGAILERWKVLTKKAEPTA